MTTTDKCPHPMRPDPEWLQKSIKAFLLGEDNPASPAWQEALAQHLWGNWMMVEEARAFLGQLEECECRKVGIKEILATIPNRIAVHGKECALWGSLSDRCNCHLATIKGTP